MHHVLVFDYHISHKTTTTSTQSVDYIELVGYQSTTGNNV